MTAVSVPAWHALAACQYADPELFFPEGEENAPLAAEQAHQARGVCRGCPVRRECLSWALPHETWGTWGGLTERERIAERSRPARRPLAEIIAEYDKAHDGYAERAAAGYARRAATARRHRAEAAESILGLVA